MSIANEVSVGVTSSSPSCTLPRCSNTLRSRHLPTVFPGLCWQLPAHECTSGRSWISLPHSRGTWPLEIGIQNKKCNLPKFLIVVMLQKRFTYTGQHKLLSPKYKFWLLSDRAVSTCLTVPTCLQCHKCGCTSSCTRELPSPRHHNCSYHKMKRRQFVWLSLNSKVNVEEVVKKCTNAIKCSLQLNSSTIKYGIVVGF